MASMRLMRAFAPAMAEHGWGRIVNVTSSAGKRPSLTNAAYSVTKAAQSSLSRVFADTYAPQGVLVNSVAPGPGRLVAVDGRRAGSPTRPPSARGLSREESIKVQEGKVPLGRFATEEEIANVVVFLCSERASTSPAPPGRSTAARLQPSSEAETIAAMPPAARVGDMHTCPMFDGPKPHVGGPILPPGAPTVLIGGMPAARVGDMCDLRRPARLDHHRLDEGDDQGQARRPHGRLDRPRRRDRARLPEGHDQLGIWTKVQLTGRRLPA